MAALGLEESSVGSINPLLVDRSGEEETGCGMPGTVGLSTVVATDE